MCFGRAKLAENYSKSSIANFGRSLFGSYCPTYVPDFVLHGIPNDSKLRQSLGSDLAHAVQVNMNETILNKLFYFGYYKIIAG